MTRKNRLTNSGAGPIIISEERTTHAVALSTFRCFVIRIAGTAATCQSGGCSLGVYKNRLTNGGAGPIIISEERTTHAVAHSRSEQTFVITHHKDSRHLAEWRLFSLRCVSLMTIVTVYLPMWNVIRIRNTSFRRMKQPPARLLFALGRRLASRRASDTVILYEDGAPVKIICGRGEGRRPLFT